MLQVNDTISQKKCKTKKATFSFGFTSFSEFLSSASLSIMIIIVMILILVSPVTYAKSVTRGLTLFFTAVLPGLLPFMLLTKLLTREGLLSKLTKPLNKISHFLFGISGSGFYAFVISIISGYPIGAKITADLYASNQISEDEVTKTAIISSTSGLIYVIGSVGGLMLGNTKLGMIIYISNILAVLIVSFLLHQISKLSQRKKNKSKSYKTSLNKIKNSPNNNNFNCALPFVASSQNKGLNNLKNKTIINKPQKQTLPQIVQDCITSLLTVAFYIAIFSLVIDLLNNTKIITFLSIPLSLLFTKLLNIPNESSIMCGTGLMSGIVEMTNGAKALSLVASFITIPLISFVTAFSGFSIIMQSFSFFNKTPIKKGKFILAKLLQALTSFIICFLFLRFI